MAEDVIIRNYIQSQARRPRARQVCRDRERENGEQRLMEYYFVTNPTYDATLFRRRFRIQKPLFHHIVDVVTTNDKYFQQRRDATGRKGLSPLQKCIGAIRVMAYGTSVDAVDEYLRMSATVTREALMRFVEGVISCFGDEYLRKPNETDLVMLLYAGEQRGFPGMIGSIDCMHWEWKIVNMQEEVGNQQSFWKLLHPMTYGYDMLSLEHQVHLMISMCFTDLLFLMMSWQVEHQRSPLIRKHKLFAEHQEAVRKDVERAFGVLQARFAFFRRPCLVWDEYKMGRIMIACIILHNMIVEDEREIYTTYYDPT